MKGNRRLIVILVFGMLVLATVGVPVVGAAGEVIWYWKDVNVSGFTLPSEDHLFDKFMNTSEAPEENINYTVTLGAGERAWWYANYPAECNLTFPIGDWKTTFWVNATNLTDNERQIRAYLYVINSTGSIIFEDYGHKTISNPTNIEKKEIRPCNEEVNVPKKGRIALRINWPDSANGSLVVYYNTTTYNSTLTSPPNSPAYPVPELSTLILFSTGLIALAGYVLLTKRRK